MRVLLLRFCQEHAEVVDRPLYALNLAFFCALNSVVSIALVFERTEEGKVQSIQRPVYYLSMLLTKPQQQYPHYQKLLLAIIMTSRKVSHYFDEHPITIVSSAPLADILNNLGATG